MEWDCGGCGVGWRPVGSVGEEFYGEAVGTAMAAVSPAFTCFLLMKTNTKWTNNNSEFILARMANH